MPSERDQELRLRPIGVIRTPHRERAQAPRQPRAARGVPGTIELAPGHNYEDALADLERWDHLWVLFWFHENQGWRPKVRPPRSDRKRGVFATRAPHRPNPLGMSVLRLVGVEGLAVHVLDVDLLDGTPILDIKPYVPWADAVPEARGEGWLPDAARPADPGPRYDVAFSALAEAQLAFLEAGGVQGLRGRIEASLALGPQPHAYRRIRREGDHFVLAVKAWRARFTVDGARVTVQALACGYRPRERATRPELALHRDFVARFGA